MPEYFEQESEPASKRRYLGGWRVVAAAWAMVRKVAVSTAIIGILGASAYVPNSAVPNPARSQEYRLSYMAGCDSGFTDAGRDGYQNAYQLNEKLFQSDSEYRSGWQDGYGACFAEQRRTPFSLSAN